MQDDPAAERILAAIADTLEERVLPELTGAPQHQVRVAANLCRILHREALLDGDLDAAASRALAQLLDGDLDADGPAGDRWAELAARLDALGDDADAERFATAAHAVVHEIVRGKLAVAKPGYDRTPDEPAGPAEPTARPRARTTGDADGDGERSAVPGGS